MTVRRKIANVAFAGRNVLRRSPHPRIKVVTTGTGACSASGVLIYASSQDGVYITVDASGTSTKISA